MHGLHIVKGDALSILFDHFCDALRAKTVGEAGAQQVGIVAACDRIVGCHDESLLRIVNQRQLVEGHGSNPLEIIRPAGDRDETEPLFPDRYDSGGLVSDISVYIGIDQVLRRRIPVAQSVTELLKVAGTIQAENGVDYFTRTEGGPAQ